MESSYLHLFACKNKQVHMASKGNRGNFRKIEGFVTNNNSALELLYGDAEYSRKGVACLNQMADCVATVFASLREFPFVGYRASKSFDATTMTTFFDLIPTKLAAGIWDCLMMLGTFSLKFDMQKEETFS